MPQESVTHEPTATGVLELTRRVYAALNERHFDAVTPMFGEICGLFTVTASVRNDVDPYAWSTMWIYPV